MKLHMDGARLANAAAHLDVPLRAFTPDAGVDILSFGGTKNGLLFGEVVVALNPEAAHGLLYLRKMNMQLASKMRFMSAQFIALLEGDLWLRSAAHANAMAARLRPAVDAIDGVRAHPETESNGVFAILPGGRGGPAAGVLPLLRLERSRPARSAGCAPSTPPRRTWTRSSRPSAANCAGHSAGTSRARSMAGGRRRACTACGRPAVA